MNQEKDPERKARRAKHGKKDKLGRVRLRWGDQETREGRRREVDGPGEGEGPGGRRGREAG